MNDSKLTIHRPALPLGDMHKHDLRFCGHSDEVIAARPSGSRLDTAETRGVEAEYLRRSGYTGAHANLPTGLFIGTLDVHGRSTRPIFVPDLPHHDEHGRLERYYLPKDSPPIVDMHPMVANRLSDAKAPYFHTSDVLLGDALVSQGHVAFNFLDGSMTNTDLKAAFAHRVLREWEAFLDGREHHRRHYVLLENNPDRPLPAPPGHFDMLAALVRMLRESGSDIVLVAPPLEVTTYAQRAQQVLDAMAGDAA